MNVSRLQEAKATDGHTFPPGILRILLHAVGSVTASKLWYMQVIPDEPPGTMC